MNCRKSQQLFLVEKGTLRKIESLPGCKPFQFKCTLYTTTERKRNLPNLRQRSKNYPVRTALQTTIGKEQYHTSPLKVISSENHATTRNSKSNHQIGATKRPQTIPALLIANTNEMQHIATNALCTLGYALLGHRAEKRCNHNSQRLQRNNVCKAQIVLTELTTQCNCISNKPTPQA